MSRKMFHSILEGLVAVSLLGSVQATSQVEKRSGLIVPSTLPGSWVSQGCWTDVGRTLSQGGYHDDGGMTDESCIAYCSEQGYIYAGTEYYSECYCGNTLAPTAAPATSTDCNTPCSGNSSESCGGPSRLNLFWSGTTGPQFNPGTGGWNFVGCYADNVDGGRTLTVGTAVAGGMTVDLCTSACQTQGYTLAGLEYASQCYCGTSFQNGGGLAPDGVSGCNMVCSGNASEFCGGPNRLSMYDFNNTVSVLPWTTISTTTVSTSSTSSKSSSNLQTTSSSLVVTSSTLSSSELPTSTSSVVVISSTLSSSTISSSSVVISSTISGSQISTSSIMSSTSSAIPTPSIISIKPSVGPYNYYGCQTEATNVRALDGPTYANDSMTLESCEAFCAASNSIFFGVEYARECYCGNSFGVGSVPAPNTDCSFPCAANPYEYCGAGNRLSVYMLNGTIVSSSSSVLPTTTLFTTSQPTTVSTTSSSAPTGSAVPFLPPGWDAYGCWIDGLPAGRTLVHELDMANNTIQNCVAHCILGGYTIAGLEYGVQCFCDTAVHNGAGLAPEASDCNVPCAGNQSQTCGGGNRLSLFSLGAPQVYLPPTAQQTGLPAGWIYSGCLQDNILSNMDPYSGDVVNIHTLPYSLPEDDYNMTATKCIERCQLYGYNAAGIEVGTQCFCGDTENLLVASDPFVTTTPLQQGGWEYSVLPAFVDPSNCNVFCSGSNSEYYCGANNLLTYYTWAGPEPLYTFNFPTGIDAGEYSLLIGGLTVPLITAQVITGKVTFVQKTQQGFDNGTGVYELDLTLVDDFDLAWRSMDKMITDPFCAASLILPDKAGRQLTVGGWDEDSNFGIRFYVPDGSAGVNGTNQWQESPEVLSLQLPRWYPSAMIMANGSIMVVGGSISSNNVEQPFLELLPPTGVPMVPSNLTISGYSNTTVYLDFLNRTQIDNLYPFVAVLPSGGIFIAYYNEARILDEVTFDTIKTLPNIPGSVDNDLGGRSYSLEGAMVLLPQFSPYTEPLEVLICGGSTPSGHYALDNCVSTQPDVPNPVWTIERMPSRRVMPCMAGLPDGTYIILNGGEHGAAGFGLGGDPNYNAVLYDPTKPVNTRMSVMANTTVARLYHSEAIVLLDGRVLVSGSDPTGQLADVLPEDTTDFPEEFRVEVFTPPYLLSGLARPTFTLTNTDWTYNETITFTLTSGSTANLKVSLLGAVASTHGNSMGQRTIFPEVSCAGTVCTVVAPPNAHICPPSWFMFFVLDGPTPSVGVFVRIGGDPAGLGNWPQGLGFDLPGV